MYIQMDHEYTGKEFKVTFFSGETKDKFLIGLGTLYMNLPQWQKICGFMIEGFRRAEKDLTIFDFTYKSVGEDEALKKYEEKKNG